jgi:hypothetical protein
VARLGRAPARSGVARPINLNREYTAIDRNKTVIESVILRDDFYFLSDQVLAKCKIFQGFDPTTPFKGSRIGQAYTIWIQTPQQTLNALLEANGMKPKGAFHADGFNICYE